MGHTIKLKCYLNIENEYVANAVIIPGQLIELMSNGKVRKHATSGGNALPMWALEDENQGKGITDSYSAGDQVKCLVTTRGDEVYAILADGETVAIGDPLESNGAGFLKKHTAETWTSNDAQQANTVYSNPIVGYALEYKDLSGSSGEGSAGESSESPIGFAKRIKIRIL